MSIENLIKNAVEGNAKKFENTFAEIMSQKVEAAIETKYENMFGEGYKNKMKEEDDMDDDEDEDEDEDEDLDEAKRPVTKDSVMKLMIKGGTNKDDAKKMVDAEFDSATRSYKDSTASKIVDVIRSTYRSNGVER